MERHTRYARMKLERLTETLSSKQVKKLCRTAILELPIEQVIELIQKFDPLWLEE